MWFKLKALFAHSRTILAARLYAVAGALVALHDIALPFITGTDLTPIASRVPSWLCSRCSPSGLASYLSGCGG